MPTTTRPLTGEMRTAVLRVAAQHGARNIRVFGSVARGEAGPDSDLDLLVDFESGRSLLDQVALTQDLERLLGRPVDVVTEDGLYWLLRRRIMGEASPAVTKDVRVYLAHIVESIDKIERFTVDGKVRFLQDPMVHDAVVRDLEIIGEAAKRIDGVYRTAHPDVPWRALAGLRDVLIHQYEGVDLERVWTVVERDLPRVRLAIGSLLSRSTRMKRRRSAANRPNHQVIRRMARPESWWAEDCADLSGVGLGNAAARVQPHPEERGLTGAHCTGPTAEAGLLGLSAPAIRSDDGPRAAIKRLTAAGPRAVPEHE